MTDRLDLPQRYRSILDGLLRAHVPDAEVWAYGSRITGESHEGSDLDLVVRGPELEPLGDGFFSLLEAIENSNIPILVQAHDWARLPESFHGEIERDYVVIQDGTRVTGTDEWQELPFSEAVLINPTVQLERGTVYPFVEMAAVNAESRTANSLEKREFKGSGSRFQVGDTLMARITPCLENGKIARYQPQDARQKAHGSTEFIVIRGRPGVSDNDFAYYLTQWEEVRNYAIGQMTGTSGRQRVPVDSLDHLIVALPPLSEQRAIAHVLGTLDNKIELNRRMNETLEEMARALFKSWFVDFDPVHAKAALNQHPASVSQAHPAQGGADCEKSSGWTIERARAYLDKMDPSIAALFPDRFVDSELGEIPDGWEVKALGEVVQLNPAEPMKRGTVAPYLDMASLPTFGSSPSTPVFREYKSGTRFRDGDTLIARITPCLENGKTAFVQVLSDDTVGWGSTEFIVLRAIPPVPPEYTYLLARDTAFREHAIQSMTGTSGRQRVQVDALAPYTLPNPPAETWNKFSILISTLFAQMESNRKESLALTAQRDALLPKLVSGDIEVQSN